MPTLPWTAGPSPRTDRSVVLTSHLALRRRRDVPAFFRESLALHRAAKAAPGCVGVSLRAHPWRRRFWTLSEWVDDAALDAYVRSPAHRAAMQRWHGRLETTWFERSAGGGSAPQWSERLEAHDRAATTGTSAGRP